MSWITIVWIRQTTNLRYYKWEHLEIAMKWNVSRSKNESLSIAAKNKNKTTQKQYH